MSICIDGIIPYVKNEILFDTFWQLYTSQCKLMMCFINLNHNWDPLCCFELFTVLVMWELILFRRAWETEKEELGGGKVISNYGNILSSSFPPPGSELEFFTSITFIPLTELHPVVIPKWPAAFSFTCKIITASHLVLGQKTYKRYVISVA